RGMRPQLLHQYKVAAQIVALKARHVAPCVADAQRADIADLAGQETAAERAVGDKADAKLLTERQDLGFDGARPQRIPDLHRAERVGGVGSPDCRGSRFAYAEMAYLSLVHEIAHGADGVLDRHGRIDTMD